MLAAGDGPRAATARLVGSRGGTDRRPAHNGTFSAYDQRKSPRARVTARSSGSGSGPLPGPFAASRDYIQGGGVPG
jgi:hypothetical protein